jgi:hypothetical protein
LRSFRPSTTLGDVKRALLVGVLLGIALPGAASAQLGAPGLPAANPALPPPTVGRPPSTLARPPDAIDQARQRALAPVPRTPIAAPPAQVWVPERRFYSSELGRQIVVPGHYETRITDQQYAVPALTGYGPRGENPVPIPGGTRPPADLRQGP